MDGSSSVVDAMACDSVLVHAATADGSGSCSFSPLVAVAGSSGDRSVFDWSAMHDVLMSDEFVDGEQGEEPPADVYVPGVSVLCCI